MNLKLIYLILLFEMILIFICYSILGYSFNDPMYNLFHRSLILILFIKMSILGIIVYNNRYTRSFYNKYVYIVLKLYIILVIYFIIKNIGSIIKWKQK